MSAPIAEAGELPVAAPRESVGGALGILLGLATIAAAGWFALRPAAREIDARSALQEAFQVGELPFELALQGAARLPGGELVVSFAAPTALASVEAQDELVAAPEPLPASQGAGLEGTGAKKVDWAALEPLAETLAPERVLLVRWPRGGADAARARHFEEVRFRNLEDLGPQGGRAPLERDALPWRGFSARAVRERRYSLADARPTFRDSVRVDLARPGQPWMLIAIWPPRAAASLAPVRELLEAFAPRER